MFGEVLHRLTDSIVFVKKMLQADRRIFVTGICVEVRDVFGREC